MALADQYPTHAREQWRQRRLNQLRTISYPRRAVPLPFDFSDWLIAFFENGKVPFAGGC